MKIECFESKLFEENTYIVSDKGDCFIVDPGMQGEDFFATLNKHNLKFILLTHGHIDHTIGLKNLHFETYILDKEKRVFSSHEDSLYALYNLKSPYDDISSKIKYLKDGDIINFASHQIKVIETPGHTAGSCCYLLDNIYLFTGDTLFNCSVGRTDLPTGNEQSLKKSLDKLMNLSNQITIYPGHGDKSNIAFEKKNNPFIKK